jgi:hypothetical protein
VAEVEAARERVRRANLVVQAAVPGQPEERDGGRRRRLAARRALRWHTTRGAPVLRSVAPRAATVTSIARPRERRAKSASRGDSSGDRPRPDQDDPDVDDDRRPAGGLGVVRSGPTLLVAVEVEGRPRIVIDALDEGEELRLADWLRSSGALPEIAVAALGIWSDLLGAEIG